MNANGLTLLKRHLTDILSDRIVDLSPVYGGRNSRVYHAICENRLALAVKVYFRDPKDKRNRLATEWAACTFMRDHHVASVPLPVFKDEEKGMAAYAFIDGEKPDPRKIKVEDVDALIRFLKSLEGLKYKKNAGQLPLASEAGFSIEEMVGIIDRRFKRFPCFRDEAAGEPDVDDFLKRELRPFYEEIKVWCRKTAERSGIDFSEKIATADRTLSPSDVGFHNVLRSPNGRLTFLDFEYFGWDDPAKVIVDFYLHPAMDIRKELRHYFVETMISAYDHIHGLGERVTVCYPLLGIKWCLILLNEFIPSDNERRRFALGNGMENRAIALRQLNKARKMVHFIKTTYKEFGYGG